MPGHDAKHVAWQVACIRVGDLTVEEALSQMPSPAMHNKLAGRLRRLGWTYHPDRYDNRWEPPVATRRT